MSTSNRFSQEDTLKIAFSVMSPGQREIFKNETTSTWRTACLGWDASGAISLFSGDHRSCIPGYPMKIPTIEELLLPDALKKISMEPRGLILCTGTTGSGKSTTLASMIDNINANKTDHIITIEDR